jgi:hypothetical protein
MSVRTTAEIKCDRCGRTIGPDQDVFCWACMDELQEENLTLSVENDIFEGRLETPKERMTRLLKEVENFPATKELFNIIKGGRVGAKEEKDGQEEG